MSETMSAQTLFRPRAQTACDSARAITEVFHRLPDGSGELGVDLRMVVEHPRDSGGGNSGCLRNVDDRGHCCSMLLMHRTFAPGKSRCQSIAIIAIG